MATITADQMKSQLLTVEDVHAVLAKTEPISSVGISNEAKIKFRLEPDWAMALDALKGTDTVGAAVTINGTEHQLSKDALLQFGAVNGLTGAYMKRTPAKLIEPHLNYWFSGGMGDKEYNVLTVGDSIAALTSPTLTPFSNLQLLDHAIEGIQLKYGSNAEILADYKMTNSLVRTDVRLIIPEATRHSITGSNMPDVLSGDDTWSAGLHLSNSLIGKKMTSIDAYLFRWWCTNGCTTIMDGVGEWSRKSNGQSDDVYEWARDSVDEILGGLEDRFEQIQALTSLSVAGNTGDVLRELFGQHELPVSQRQTITDTLLDSQNLTMYSVMQAVTAVANDPSIDPLRADRLMRIGGEIPATHFDSTKSKVWREGHTAPKTAKNPYEISVTATVE